MLSRCLGLLSLLWIGLAHAIPNDALMSNLKARLHPLPSGGTLIKSFTNHTQSYIYDQALAVIAFTNEGDFQNAKKLLSALKTLQKDDGSLYFSYYLDGQSDYPSLGDKRFAGAISWVALAAVTYQHHSQDRQFVGFNRKILNYLSKEMKPVAGKDFHALRFSPGDIVSTSWNEKETAALEHNLDAYSAFVHFSRLNKTQKWNKDIQNLKSFITSMWDKSRSHFWSGLNLKTGAINKQELYLDNQTWSLLALDKETLRSFDTKEALNLNCDVFLVEHEGVTGFMDSKPTRRPASSQFVWSEGTAGQILAVNKYNEMHRTSLSCKNHETKSLLESIARMKKEDGGIAYATSTPNPDFTTASSVAGTVWYYFASNNINPFEL